jgi:DNA polymerase-3 subunit gamma/tau
VLFDRVLAQGFSGQTFMAGLGGHLRDLLVARNPATVELLDVTGGLMERYREQAARCGVDFLFGGIALLTDLDARVRTATNQRLMVELALMKLCSLASPEGTTGAGDATSAAGEKKKFEPQLAPEVSLPPLRRESIELKPSGGDASPEPSVKTDGNVSDRKDSGDTPVPSALADGNPQASSSSGFSPTQKPAPSPSPPKGSGAVISGPSLSEIMNGSATPKTSAPTEEAAPLIDPEAGEKIERHRDRFLERLTRERPRIGVAFETMEVSGNALTVRVASQTLHDEILRWRTETLQLLATVAGVKGSIELAVVIDERAKPTRPIRLEDKVKHLAELNPEFNNLRRVLDLEIE